MDTEVGQLSIEQAIKKYIQSVSLSRSARTARTYQNGLNMFQSVLRMHHIEPQKNLCTELPEDAILWFANALKDFSPATERLYLTAAKGLYEIISAENLAIVNLPRISLLIHQRSRRPGKRLPQFPRIAIEEVVNYALNLIQEPVADDLDHLRNLRDRAFLVTLADTGLRVHEACNLRRGDIDWQEQRAVIIGKGDKEAVVRFSSRSIKAIKDYLAARAGKDGASGKPLTSLPIFARHDKGTGKRVTPMTTTTGRNIVSQRVGEAIGADAIITITPHSFRHYFVTTVLRGSGGNLKLAQNLARHQNIAVTQRYAHLSDDELDKGYTEIFEKPEK
jgi:site-specific recombinase XerD